MDREKAASMRYNLANKIKNYRLDPNAAYIIDNLEHLKQLKFQLLEKTTVFLIEIILDYFTRKRTYD